MSAERADHIKHLLLIYFRSRAKRTGAVGCDSGRQAECQRSKRLLVCYSKVSQGRVTVGLCLCGPCHGKEGSTPSGRREELKISVPKALGTELELTNAMQFA